MELIKSDIEFKMNEKQIKFSIIHNLPKIRGLSLNDALDNWLVRTRKFTAKSLVKYINSKNTEFVAMTESQYNRIKRLGHETKQFKDIIKKSD